MIQRKNKILKIDDVRIWFKFGSCAVGIIIFGICIGFLAKRYHKSDKEIKYCDPLYDPSLYIVLMNTMTIYFSFLSIQEFKLYEYMDPIYVDHRNIPRDCKDNLQRALFCFGGVIIVSVLYNIMYLFKPRIRELEHHINTPISTAATSSSSTRFPTSSSSSSTNYTDILTRVHNKKKDIFEIHGYKTVYIKGPSLPEIVLFSFLNIASIIVYIAFVSLNYAGDEHINVLNSCAMNISRYITETQTSSVAPQT